MSTTIRLSPETEIRLQQLAQRKHKSKSQLIKEAIEMLFRSEDEATDAYTAGKDLFGRAGSGDGTLSTTYKRRLLNPPPAA